MNTIKNETTIHLGLNRQMWWKLNTLNDLSNRIYVPNKQIKQKI